MFGKGVLTRRVGRSAAVGVAGLSACLLIAACSPVKMGSAAIVGNQRITVSTVDTQVSNLQAAAKPYAGQFTPLTAAEAPTAVLSWLIRFAVMNQVAASKGITVTQAQSSQALDSLSSVASENGFNSTAALLIANGVPPQLFPEVGTWEAQQTAYAATKGASQSAFDTLECKAAKTLNIQVSPQFGRLDYTDFTVVAAANTLSAPEGVPSPASTEGLAPAC